MKSRSDNLIEYVGTIYSDLQSYGNNLAERIAIIQMVSTLLQVDAIKEGHDQQPVGENS